MRLCVHVSCVFCGGSGWRGKLDDQRGGVVATGRFDGFVDELLREAFPGRRGRWSAEKLLELAIPEPVDHTVGANQEAIAWPMSDGADVRLDELLAGAEHLLKRVAAWMRSGFAFIELAFATEPADVGVIMRHLRQRTVVR